MALRLTFLCLFLSPSWTTAWGDPYLVIVGGGNGKALKARLCGDAIRQTAVGMRSPPHPGRPVQYLSLPFFCCSTTITRCLRSVLRSLAFVWAGEAPGNALGFMLALSRRVFPIPQSQVASSDKTLWETSGICCKFSTLDRKINRDYLERRRHPSGLPLLYPGHGAHR